MMKKHKKLITNIAIVVVILVMFLGLFLVSQSEDKKKTGDNSSDTLTIDGSSENGEDADSADGEGENASEKGGTGAWSAPSSSGGSGSGSSEEGVAVNGIQFPYVMENLTVQKVQSFDGTYLEDGSNKEVTGIAAILVTNTGEKCVEYAEISLAGDGIEWKFDLSALEAGESCVVLEANGAQYTQGIYTSCSSETALLDEMDMSKNLVEVTETKSGALNVKNVSKEDIPCVRVFYKYYSEDEDVYIGGIAYTAKVTDLKAGFTKMVTPSNYVAGQSKVIMVRTYDSAE